MSSMKNEVFILCCDTDAQSHGAFSTLEKAIFMAEDIIEAQPFHIPCDMSDFYVEKFLIDDDGRPSEMIDL